MTRVNLLIAMIRATKAEAPAENPNRKVSI